MANIIQIDGKDIKDVVAREEINGLKTSLGDVTDFVGDTDTNLGTHTEPVTHQYIKLTNRNITYGGVKFVVTDNTVTVSQTATETKVLTLQDNISAVAGNYTFSINTPITSSGYSLQIWDIDGVKTIKTFSSSDTDTSKTFTLDSTKNIRIRSVVNENAVLNDTNTLSLTRVADESFGNTLAFLAAKQLTFVTPEIFGAVGDGVADDTAAVQAAINHGGLILCNNTYRITGDVYLRNPDHTGDNSSFPRSRIVGKSGIIAQLASNTQIDYLQVNQATFYHDGGKFVFKYTSNVEFSECVFMGCKTHSKTDFAFFAAETPYRRLHIENCTFANFECAIYGYRASDDSAWSGENIFDGLYFALCDYCICLENGGYDSVFRNMIAQGSCGYFLRLTSAAGAMIQGNHDYSENGSVIYGAANIIGNYIDGVGKLHVKGGSSGSGVNKAKNSPVIVGNSFLVPSSVEDWCWIIAVDEYLMGAVVCDNIIFGGADAYTMLFNTTNATYFYQNQIRNNTGKIFAYLPTSITAQNTYYGNDFDIYRVYVNAGTGTAVYDKFFWGSKCASLFCKYTDPSMFYLQGTVIQGIYSSVLSFIKVKLTDDSEDRYTFTYDGADLHSAIASKWGFANIAEIEAEIHINFGNTPTEAYPVVSAASTTSRNYTTNIAGVTVPTAPDYS